MHCTDLISPLNKTETAFSPNPREKGEMTDKREGSNDIVMFDAVWHYVKKSNTKT